MRIQSIIKLLVSFIVGRTLQPIDSMKYDVLQLNCYPFLASTTMYGRQMHNLQLAQLHGVVAGSLVPTADYLNSRKRQNAIKVIASTGGIGTAFALDIDTRHEKMEMCVHNLIVVPLLQLSILHNGSHLHARVRNCKRCGAIKLTEVTEIVPYFIALH
jgi:hypothetical protein